ncbi:MAG: hypothetical protein H0Z35_12380 [Thermoanaerobacteraceae bacterium]|nr:hypothetical protein [Thermoanaerobacteraceae bacterium]
MPGLGAFAHVGLGKETTFGTPVAASDYIKIISESIAHEIEELVLEGLGGVVDEPASLEGLNTVAGDLNVEVHPESIGHLLRSALGEPVTSGTGPYTHTFTPAQDNFSPVCALPPYTLEVHRDLEQAFQFTGCVVNQLQFNWGVNQKIMQATANILGKDVALIAKTTPSFETNEPFTWHQVNPQVGNPLTAIDTISAVQISINNNLEAVPTLNNTKTISRIRRNGFRVVEVQFTFEVEDLAEYNRFKNQEENAFQFEFTSGSNKIKFDLPKVRYNAFPLGVGGSGRLTVQVSGKAKYDAATGKAIEITLTNGKVSY